MYPPSIPAGGLTGGMTMATKPKKFESSGSEPGDGSVRVGTGGGGGTPPPPRAPKPNKQAPPPKGGSKTSKGA